jgi:spectinomycin phosphotransferase
MREGDLRLALAEGWRIQAAALRYAPVGGGSYHWEVRDQAARRWFVTVDDLEDKPWLGTTRTAVLAGLATAMEVAVALRGEAGLRFVAAPVPGTAGQAVRPVDGRYAVAVFRFVDGRPGRFGAVLAARERAARVDLLAALHQSTAAARRAAVSQVELPRRTELEILLDGRPGPWRSGPFAEAARVLLARSRPLVTSRLAAFDQLAGAARRAGPVITHGEPHPGNVLRAGQARVLVDWDTAGLAPPERDLWLVAGPGGRELARYARATGRPADPELLEFYRLRWALDDLSAFAARLRGPHRRTADAARAWRNLQLAIQSLGRRRPVH